MAVNKEGGAAADGEEGAAVGRKEDAASIGEEGVVVEREGGCSGCW